METFLTIFTDLTHWVEVHPLDAADISFMLVSAATVFLCRYEKRRDSVVGTILIICWVYQIWETLGGERVSAPSDVVFDGVFFLVIFSAGGNIMSIVVISKLMSRIKSIWLLIKRPFTFMVKK
ncbi:hypothetical protein J0A78_05455 [Providencia rettgeri]|uniref:hypothetical protein n=1 Tax=Providencia TaxID=586 RepID=UPI0018C6BF9B|nr:MULTISPECIES: hypothetical protein [Providencia]MBG5927565.1 hypothetical protein [Providencia rettgeri]MBN7841164.1 hypothetical protein [Providencia rettgeri]MBN7852723.1 hypothetical protein [Providencia rettgeri]MBN7862440.1 hypothetical protein [Providencia rettgeri]MBN7871991.1 hypothetical protein [Providencia rettgeri]